MLRGRSIGTPQANPSKSILLLTNRVGTLTVLLHALALTYAALIISQFGTEKAKIQENALLAGLVEEQWKDTLRLDRFLNEMRGKVGAKRSELRDYVMNSLVEMGVEVARQTFKMAPSSFSATTNGTTVGRANVYAIVRAFRATPAESILLIVPMRPSQIEAIAVALTFVDYAKKQLYWARDLIFLFVDGGDKVAAEAWFSAYHGRHYPFIKLSGEDDDDDADFHLELHGGQIIGAFVLDFSGTVFSHIGLQYSMVNGKLPNMDLLNLCVLLIEKAGTVPSLHGLPPQQSRGGVAEEEEDGYYAKAAKTVLRGILSQSMNEVESLASVAGRYGINAVALSAHSSAAKANAEQRDYHQQQHHHLASITVDLGDTVRLVEGAVRSLNNLLEKFHHSYLLYVMTSPHRFVSVAFYMPLVGLLLSPLVILALREWFRMGGAVHLAESVGSAAFVRLLLAPLVALSFYGVQLLCYANWRFPAKTLAVPLSLLLPLCLLAVFARIPPISSSSPVRAIHFARFAVGIQLTLFLGSLSLVHFPLALLLSLLLLPQAVSTLIFDHRKWLRICLFFVLHPVAISLLLICLTSDFCASPAKCWRRLSVRIIHIVRAHFLHDSWLLPIFAGPLLAICLAMSQIVFCCQIEPKCDDDNTNNSKNKDDNTNKDTDAAAEQRRDEAKGSGEVKEKEA